MNSRAPNSSKSSFHEELFNFSFHKAVEILEEHLMRDSLFTRSTELIIISCYVVLMVAGVCSNLLMFTVITRSAKICTMRNLYVVNLNVSDVALCLFCMPFTVFSLVRRSWSMGQLLCKLVPFLQGSTVFVSAATVSAIAIDRHNAIVTFNPQTRKRSIKTIAIYLVCIWVFAITLSIPMLITQEVTHVGLSGIVSYEKCIESWPSPCSKGMYTVMILVTQFFIPAIVLVVTHFRIKAHLNITLFRRDFRTPQHDSERLQRELRRNHRATMVLMNISVVFAISWLPWNVLNLLADFKPHVLSLHHLYLAFAVCHMLAMSSATTNPLLYGWLNTNIRKELLRVREKMGRAFSMQRSSPSENAIIQMEKAITHLTLGDLDAPKQLSVCSKL